MYVGNIVLAWLVSLPAHESDLLQAKRDPDEEGDYMAFEQLMAEAAVKKGKDEKKDDKKDGKKTKKDDTTSSNHHHFPQFTKQEHSV